MREIRDQVWPEESGIIADRPPCDLLGIDGNVYSVIGYVSHTLKCAGYHVRARQWREAAIACENYDAVLALVHDYVVVI